MPITPNDRPIFTQLSARADQLDRDVARLHRIQNDLDRTYTETLAEHDAVTAIIELISPEPGD